MIIPTPEFNPLFAEDGVPFREKMIRWIERHYGAEIGAARLAEVKGEIRANAQGLERLAA